VGSIDRRIQDLERLLGGAPEADSEERKRLIEELKARWPAFEEKMAREEAEGNFARRRALEEIEESVKRRMQARRS
jgi:molecular chaperone GrpE (heat shock protein)